MWAVSWHDKADVLSPRGDRHISSGRADSGRQPAGFVVELVSANGDRLAESRAARIPTSHGPHRAGVVVEQICALAGKALAELKVAGPHAIQRQVDFGVPAGGMFEVHAAVGPSLAESRRAETRRTKSCSHSPRPSWSVSTADSVGGGRRVFGSRCLGSLFAVVAPLVAGERVSVGAAAALSAWPPALRERWHTCRRCGGSLGVQGPANNGMQLT